MRLMIKVADLYVLCSFPLHSDAIAMSDNCRKPANSAAHKGRLFFYRCQAHRGLWNDGSTVEVTEEVPHPYVDD